MFPFVISFLSANFDWAIGRSLLVRLYMTISVVLTISVGNLSDSVEDRTVPLHTCECSL